MTPDELTRPSVPAAYVHLTLQLAEEYGVPRGRLLGQMGIDESVLEQPDAYFGLLDYGRLCLDCLELCGEPAFGYEFGMRNNTTLHGFYGFGVMSQPTVREAIEFAIRFAPMRIPGWSFELKEDDGMARVECLEAVPFGLLSQYAQEVMLIGLHTSFKQFLPSPNEAVLCFENVEPPYHSQYAGRLPTCRFATGGLSMCFPKAHLEAPLVTANLVTARLIARECERELARLGINQNLLERVRAEIRWRDGSYPTLSEVAHRLYLSCRTLKRQLKAHNLGFRDLLNEQRKRDSIHLLSDPTLSQEAVSARVGYSAPANFVRAFKSWTGLTPGEFRRRHLS